MPINTFPERMSSDELAVDTIADDLPNMMNLWRWLRDGEEISEQSAYSYLSLPPPSQRLRTRFSRPDVDTEFTANPRLLAIIAQLDNLHLHIQQAVSARNTALVKTLAREFEALCDSVKTA